MKKTKYAIIICFLLFFMCLVGCNDTKIELKTNSSLNLNLGEEFELVITSTSNKKYTENDVINNLSYQVEDSTILSLNGKTIKAIKPGSTKVVVYWNVDKDVKVEINVNVKTPELGETIVDDKLSLVIGETKEIIYSCDNTLTVSWKSTEEAVATVENGKVTGQKVGSTVIIMSVTNGYVTKNFEIAVTVNRKISKITYVIEGENHPDNPSSYEEGVITKLYEPTREGYRFVGWILEESTLITEISAEMIGDVTLTAQWEYIPLEFNITYILDGGINHEENPLTYVEGSKVILNTPSREGYTFKGWLLNGEIVTEISISQTGDLVLTALWEEIKTVEALYNLNGGSFSWTVGNVTSPAKGIDSVSNLPEMFMADFFHYLKTNQLLDAEIISESLVPKTFLWSSFSADYNDPKALYNWTSTGGYNAQDGYAQFFWDTLENNVAIGGFFGTSPYKEKYQNLLNHVIQLTNIKYSSITGGVYKAGFGFVLDGYFYGTQGLMKSGTNYEVFNALRALIPTPTIAYNGSSIVTNTYEVSVVDKGQTLQLTAPFKEGYVFLGWYDNEKCEGNAITEITKTTKLYAKWLDLNASQKTYSITYELDGGSLNENLLSYKEGEGLATLPLATKDGYRFLGWSTELNSNVYITSISKYAQEDITLFANFSEIKDILITYDYSDGTTPTYIATSFDVFAEVFWNEFYAWSKSTLSLETFKANAIKSWIGSSEGGFKLYKLNGQDVVDNNYFVNAKGNELWLEWFNKFEKIVSTINGTHTAWGSNYVGYKRLGEFFSQSTASYWKADYFKTLYSAYPIHEDLVTSFYPGSDVELVGLVVDDGRTFLGWYDEFDNLVTSTKDITSNITLYAKWSQSIPMESIKITNKIDKILRLTTYQLQWEILPLNTTNKRLKFTSSDKNVLTIDENGLITGLLNGTATITIEVLDNADFNISFDVTVYEDPYIDLTFETTNVVATGETIKVLPTLKNVTGTIKYQSLDEEIVTIDSFGTITAHKSGYAIIKLYIEEQPNVNITAGVTVQAADIEDIFEVIRNAHNSEIHVMRALNVAYAYYTDVYNSVSDLLFNYDYSVNESLLIPTTHKSRPTTKIDTMEFITIHYTAGTPSSSNAEATARYFNNTTVASANYCTGNDGIYMTIPDGEVSWHAGDGTTTPFEWYNTGVKATANVKPTWGVIKDSKSSSGYYFTVNGEPTTLVVPTQGYSSTGVLMTMKDPENRFTFYGPAWKVVDGYYYMGKTWACFTQTLAGAISSRGGNLNSVGIETACNQGSDLWYTYQITAQLVARLLDKYNLDTTRVVGHNMFSGKDCPQTLLAEGGELWYPFMECVEAENALYQLKLGDRYKITCKSNNPDLVQDNGRVLSIPYYTTTVSYTVTVLDTQTNQTYNETYSTIIHGTYTE